MATKRDIKRQRSAIVDLELVWRDCDACADAAYDEGRKGEARAWRAVAKQIRAALRPFQKYATP